MTREVFDLYHNTIKNLLGCIIRNQLTQSDHIFAAQIIIEGKPVQQYIEEQIAIIFEKGPTPQKLLKLLDPQNRHHKTQKKFFEWLQTDTNGAEYLLATIGIPKLLEIANSKEVASSSYKKRRDALDQLANKLNLECFSAWKRAILNTNYFLSDDELAMIGCAYDRSIVLIERGADNNITACQKGPEYRENRVFVFAQGNHYERCT
ncbi:MAG: hypothetical protein SNF33_02310 [Candidatus Algichlamydia australiensis]|nr:hypothetical protein [Chlamydiales bacterium]